MNTGIKNHAIYGKCLFADNGVIEVGIPLDFGLRVGHFSFVGEKNVFFEQPNDMEKFTTDKGWRIRGGHRLWIAPESPLTNCPDNEPISYTVSDDTVTLVQKEDPWLHIIKTFTLKFDGAKLEVVHRIENLSEDELECSLWAISVMAAGGTEYIDFERRDGGMDHWHRISTWDYTSLGDPRATYTRDEIKIRHLPVDERYKIGVGHPFGPVRYENDGVVFKKYFAVEKDKIYPDANVSYETFFSQYMVEMESLSPLGRIEKGERMEHSEVWELLRK